MNWIRFVLWCVVALALLPISALAEEDRSIAIHGVEGYGKSRQLALADAFRNAIGQALGTYVVTSRQWDGEALDKKIFDNSDAVVKTHRVVDEKESGGRWSVTIDAEIVRNEMMKFIRREAAVKVDEGELANLLAKRNAINNAVKSLELLFQNWRENIYRVEKCGSLSISASDNMGDVVHVSVPFIISFRWDSYNIFLDKVRNVLSRIAIDKTKGVYDAKDDRDFLEKNYLFYSRVGLAHKTDEGYIRTTGNPNQYGEIRVISCSSETKMVYEIFIVPYQVKACMDSLLNREVGIRCAFTSKGGEVISKSLISGEVYSFGWFEICDDDVGLGYGYAKGCLTVMDKIQTDFYNRHWSERRLYHASVPVPLNAASRISSCTLTICPLREDDNCIRGYDAITSETMNADEWLRIDNKPKIETPSRTTVTKANAVSHVTTYESSSREGRRSGVNDEPTYSYADRITISESDKKLKNKVEELSRLSPDMAAASKWFKLAKEIEAEDFRQMVMKVVALALIHLRKHGAYKNVRDKIQNVAQFEETFYVGCRKCDGAKTISRKCLSCFGKGTCVVGNCRDGVRLVHGISADRYDRCTFCNGSGRCVRCGGLGRYIVKCAQCSGTGRVVSDKAVTDAYHVYVGEILRAFQDGASPSKLRSQVGAEKEHSVTISVVDVVSVEEFAQEVTLSKMPVLVYFWASRCGQCRKMEPVVAGIARSGKVKVVKVNVDDGRELAKMFNVCGTPTFKLFCRGKVVKEVSGRMTRLNLERALGM